MFYERTGYFCSQQRFGKLSAPLENEI